MSRKLNKLITDIVSENIVESRDDFSSLLYDKLDYFLNEKKKKTLLLGKNKNDDEEDDLDSVDKSELKGKHADRDDKDIDNDGDVDSSDKFLHKKRKAISKAMKKEGRCLPCEQKARLLEDEEDERMKDDIDRKSSSLQRDKDRFTMKKEKKSRQRRPR